MTEIIAITLVRVVMVKPLLVKPLERNMFVQIFEHILHGTSIQMEQRNDS